MVVGLQVCSPPLVSSFSGKLMQVRNLGAGWGRLHRLARRRGTSAGVHRENEDVLSAVPWAAWR